MPPISTQYTLLENLLFLQSLDRNGGNFSALGAISRWLTSNDFVRDQQTYDAARLAPEALRVLYEDLVRAEGDRTSSNHWNGVGGEVNPRKRKLSASAEPSTRLHYDAWRTSSMVDHLHARYRERVIKEIRQEEQRYQELVAEIATLEDTANLPSQKAIQTPTQNGLPSLGRPPSPAANCTVSPTKVEPDRNGSHDVEPTTSKDASFEEKGAQSVEGKSPPALSTQMLPPQAPSLESPLPRPLPSIADSQHPSSTPEPRTSPAPLSIGSRNGVQQPPILPSPTRSGQSPLPLPNTALSRSSNALPPISSIMPQPPQNPHPASRRGSGSLPSPSPPLLPSLASQYQQSSPYGYQYPQWSHFNSPNPSYVHPPGYHLPPYSRNLPPAQSPVYYPYRHCPYSPPPNQYGPGPYHAPAPPAHHGPPPHATPSHIPSAPAATPPAASQQGQAPHYGYVPRPGQPVSAAVTPSAAGPSKEFPVRLSGTSTPWTPGGTRQTSPERPRDRDVSPVSSGAPSPKDAVAELVKEDGEHTRQESSGRDNNRRSRSGSLHGSRAMSSFSSAPIPRSRPQSPTSAASETLQEHNDDTKFSAGTIKREAPATPLPLTSDGEQPSSGRRRNRGDGRFALPENARNVKKRDSEIELSPSASLRTPHQWISRSKTRPELIDPSSVVVSKNFARMANPILNDVNGHKVAGIFAKPVNERDAPGYGDLIYRPQDLKSVRTAVVRGSRAANAMMDEIETNKGDEESGSNAPSVNVVATSAVKNWLPPGSELASKTEDLTPPKGIVNSAQLEMELMRVFANAIMFNPLPPSERGLMPNLDMQRDRTSFSLTAKADRDKKKGPEKRKQQQQRKGKKVSTQRDEPLTNKAKEKNKKEDPSTVVTATTITTAEEEEGGIIQDTRDMFTSVEKAVAQWRGLEQGIHHHHHHHHHHLDHIPRGSIGLRGGSVSVSTSEVVGGAEDSAPPEELPAVTATTTTTTTSTAGAGGGSGGHGAGVGVAVGVPGIGIGTEETVYGTARKRRKVVME